MVPALLISLSHSLTRLVRSSTEPLAHRNSRRCEKANRKNQSYPSEDMGKAIVPRINFLNLNGIVINFHRHIGCAEWFGMKTALLMQRALLHGQRLQGDHPKPPRRRCYGSPFPTFAKLQTATKSQPGVP